MQYFFVDCWRTSRDRDGIDTAFSDGFRRSRKKQLVRTYWYAVVGAINDKDKDTKEDEAPKCQMPLIASRRQ